MDKRHRPYSRWLAVSVAVAGVLLLTSSASAADAALAWDSNSEVDLAGYGVYFQKFPLDQQYELFGYVALEELDDPASPTFLVSGLDLGSQYQFAVTAYDAAGNESAYSAPACAEIGTVNVAIACPSSEGGSGGGGGGGGCFIGSVSGEPGGLALSLIGLPLALLFVYRKSIRDKLP